MRILLFLCGYVTFFVPNEEQTSFFEVCRRLMITPKLLSHRKGGVRLCLRYGEARMLLDTFGKQGEGMVVRRGGLPLLFLRLSRRVGLLVGILLASVLFFASTLVLFDVRIVGVETVKEGEVLEALENAGLSVGRFIPRVDTEKIELTLREWDPRLAYVSVQIKGNVATVTVREAVPEAPPLSRTPAHLIAKCDGVVTMPLVFEGECVVKEGEVVRAGQILATGFTESENGDVRLTRAAGQIMARTTSVFTVHAPLVFEETVDGGAVGHEISLFFFGFEQKVFKNCGNVPNSCDIIKSIYRPRVGTDGDLPIGIRHVEYRERVTVTKTRTAKEALDAAERELAALLVGSGELGTVLEKSIETVADAEGITLICTVVSERDIASVAEFSLEEQ